jgi:hypothetical protein
MSLPKKGLCSMEEWGDAERATKIEEERMERRYSEKTNGVKHPVSISQTAIEIRTRKFYSLGG